MVRHRSLWIKIIKLSLMNFYLAIAILGAKGFKNNTIFHLQFNYNVFELSFLFVTTFHTFSSTQYVKTVANKKINKTFKCLRPCWARMSSTKKVEILSVKIFMISHWSTYVHFWDKNSFIYFFSINNFQNICWDKSSINWSQSYKRNNR